MIGRLEAIAGRCGSVALLVLVLGSPVLLPGVPVIMVRLYYVALLALAAPHFILLIARRAVRWRDARKPAPALVAPPLRTEPDAHQEEERLHVLAKAATLPLADAVFVIVEYNDWRRTYGLPPYCKPISLSELGSRADGQVLEDLSTRARRLRQNAYVVGDALLGRDPRYESIRAALVSAHPGFGADTYERAISYGCYQAR